jgi:two-component system, NtrC family, response regulator AtoC
MADVELSEPWVLSPRDDEVDAFAYSPAMRSIRRIIEEVAGTNAAVLIRGESGAGKDVVARAIHAASPRHQNAWVKVNCAALPADLLEAELFGHEKGAFTGAHRRKLGKFEFAHLGTIFLDEIGELPLPLQPKLLHVLQDLAFFRIGGRELIKVDVRVVASTNRNLELALENGQFREDLYYRLNVVEIQVPPLRHRREEIPALATLFLKGFNRQYRREVTLSSNVLELFTAYSWPGNVRELENIVRRLVVLANAKQVCDELLTRLRMQSQPVADRLPDRIPDRIEVPPSNGGVGLKEIARQAALDAERRALLEVLNRVRWNRTEAAQILKVSYKTLLNKITECGLSERTSRRSKAS